MIIEIKKGPDANGNFKRLFIDMVPGNRMCLSEEYHCLPDISFAVTPTEFRQWDTMRKAQEAKSK